MTFKTLTLGVLLASALCVQGAHAVPLAAGSQISFTGGVAPIGGSDIATATGLDFLDRGNAGSATGTISLNADGRGSFLGAFTMAGCPASASAGGCGIIKDIRSFSMFQPIAAFYTVTEGQNTVIFDLDTLPKVKQESDQFGPTILIAGTGTFHYGNFDATKATFQLSSQGDGTTTFSASTTAVAVDEPATVALLVAGVLTVGLMNRRKQA